MNLKTDKFNLAAQTAIELAVFGAILIFVVGLIVRTGLSNAQRQNHALRGIRMAMTISFESSEGLWGTALCGGNAKVCGPGVAANNNASILLVEDRLSTDLSKYGARDRVPLFITSSGTHSRNLYMPVDPKEVWNLPMTHYIINGKHFAFTLADFDPTIYSKAGNRKFPAKIPNYPNIKDWNPAAPSAPVCPAAGCWMPWDLNCDGVEDVPANMKATFAWQWGAVTPEINTLADIDGDCKEEQVITLDKDKVYVIDYQRGDFDASRGSADPPPPPGLQNDMALYTEVQPGTFLQITDSSSVQVSTKRKQTVDLVERVIILSNNTERFCKSNTVVNPLPGTNIQNPVEVCDISCSGPNTVFTCYDTDGSDGSPANMIYVRSRIKNVQGRKWRTDFSGDDTINFLNNTSP